MKRLQQDKYHDNHADWLAEQIDTLAPCQHISDGFYTWECGSCHRETSSRTCGWPIAGIVEKCQFCEKVNLLVSTATAGHFLVKIVVGCSYCGLTLNSIDNGNVFPYLETVLYR